MNDNKSGLRVVEKVELSEQKRDLISSLRRAIEVVEQEDCVGVTISVIKENGDIVNIASSTENRSVMVAAALYQLLDIAGVADRNSRDG